MRRQTPEILQERFGIAAEEGRLRALPRAWMAYSPPKRSPATSGALSELDRRRKPPRKAEFLATMWTLALAGALPGDGDRADWKLRHVTQDVLGKMSGITRPSFTRRLSRFASRHGRPCPPLDPTYEFVTRSRRFGQANDYALGKHLPQRASRPRREDPRVYSYPTCGDLASHTAAGHLFQANQKGANGFFQCPRWVGAPELDLSATGRLVLQYYVHCGLLEREQCTVRQSLVAQSLGISVRSVYRANRELAALGLIRVAHSKPKELPDGRLIRGPQIIVFLPWRTMTREEAAAEAKRLMAARHRLQAEHLRWWDQIVEIHGRLLADWIGKERRLPAFHEALRGELKSCNVPRQAIHAVIPPRAP